MSSPISRTSTRIGCTSSPCSRARPGGPTYCLGGSAGGGSGGSSAEARRTDLVSGRVGEARLERFLGTLIPPETVDEWYLCGPLELVTTARRGLLAHGVARAPVPSELFPGGDPPPPPPLERPANLSVVTAILDGRRSTVELADPDETVLEA